MPLRVAETTAIPLPVGAVLDNGLGGAGSDLGYNPQLQEQSEWCWATCLKIVLEAHGTAGKTQCDFANAAFACSGCCLAPSSSFCNQPIRTYNFANEYHRYGLGAVYVEGSLPLSTIQDEIKAGNPIQIGIKWEGKIGGHALLITGWDTTPDGNAQRVIWINTLDQSLNRTVYEDFVTYFQQWQWRWSWTGIKKGA